jgi:N-acetyl-anhydromuramyl-L-alanine amidase AmpD
MEIKQDLTPINYTASNSRSIKGIVLHSMWGTYAGSIAWFKNPDAKASAHYCISETGEITQCVLDKNIAWQAGIFDEPNPNFPGGTIPSWLKPNPNNVTIGIELEDKRDANWAYPQPQRAALVELVDFLCNKYSIPKDTDHIFLHKALNPSRRTDPVGAFDIKWITGATIDPGMDQYESAGFAKLKAYRAVRTVNGVLTPEGNFEGFANVIIDSDKNYPGTVKALEEERNKRITAEVARDNALGVITTKDLAIASMKDQIGILEKKLLEAQNPQIIIKEPEFKTSLARFLYSWAKSLG